MRRVLLSTAVVAVLAVPATANAAVRHVVRGAGWGHGIGMSQYGAYGYAREGAGYRKILAHYYSGTRLVQAAQRSVRVLLQPDDAYIRVRGATSAGGKRLSPSKTYVARPSAGGIALFGPSGRRVGRFSGRLRLERPGGTPAARPGAQRRERRALPGCHRGARRRRAGRDQRALGGRLHARGRGRRDALLLADGGAQGPGGDGAQLRPRHAQDGRPRSTSTRTPARRCTAA